MSSKNNESKYFEVQAEKNNFERQNLINENKLRECYQRLNETQVNRAFGLNLKFRLFLIFKINNMPL